MAQKTSDALASASQWMCKGEREVKQQKHFVSQRFNNFSSNALANNTNRDPP